MNHALPTGFEPEFQATPGTTEGESEETRSVVYVDDASRLQMVTEYVEREGSDLAVVGTSDHEAAVDAIEEADWDCLVVGDVPTSVRQRLRRAADCPVVRYTENPRRVDAGVPVVARGGDDTVEPLLETVARRVDASGHASPLALTGAAGTSGDDSPALFLVDEDGTVAWSSDLFEAAFPVEAADADVPDTDDFYARLAAVAADVPAALLSGDEERDADCGRLCVPTREGDRFYRHERHRIPAEGGRRLELFEDVTAEQRRDGTPGRDGSTGVDRAYAVLQDVVRDLGTATSREDLSERVCRRLVDRHGFPLAWMGQREGANERVVPTTVAGGPESLVREAVAATSREDVPDGPVFDALVDGEVQTVEEFSADAPAEAWRDLARSAGLESMAVAPLTHGETIHGVLVVYGEEVGAFDEPVAESVRLLGETVGFALTAVQNRRLLQRDVTLELEFRSQSDDAWMVGVARDIGGRLETAGSVDIGEEFLQYVRVEGACPGHVAAEFRQSETVEQARVVRAGDEEGGVLEVRVTESLPRALSDAGARLCESVATPSGTRIVVEAPTDANVRAIHETVRRFHPGAKLACKTELEDPLGDDSGFCAAFDALTDRQAEVLRAAYLAGYYAWPRDTTAEELADSLDIASPTLHQHMRRAEHNLLESLFDES